MFTGECGTGETGRGERETPSLTLADGEPEQSVGHHGDQDHASGKHDLHE